MSEWGDRHEEESHDEGKVGSKRPRGSRGPEGKLAQKARTLRRRAAMWEAFSPFYNLAKCLIHLMMSPMLTLAWTTAAMILHAASVSCNAVDNNK